MRPWLSLPLAVAVGLTSACGEMTGAVELAWVFVDRDGDPIFPGGVFSAEDERDACALPGKVDDAGVAYDLRVELAICDPTCAAGCEADECLVLPRRRFACNSARGNEPEVPASDDPYRFVLRAALSAPSMDIECLDAAPACLAVPSPRERVVEAGLVTDLQVYQIAIDVDRRGEDPRLELGEAGCGCA